MKYTSQDIKCLHCGKPGVDLHHIISRKAGGTDDPWNLLPVCHPTHVKIHSSGLYRISMDNPPIKAWLETNGWELQNEFGRMKWRRQ